MKQKLHSLLYNTPYLDRSILLLIVLSVLGIIPDTIPSVHTKILRILKVNRYNNSMHLVGSVIKEKRYELLVTSFVALIVIIISTLLMYSLEGPEQSGAFPNLFAAFQWTLGTMASIGSNNLFPSTATGHVIGGIIGFFSIGLVALPTSIIGAGFIERVEQKKMQKQQYVVVKEKLMLLHELYDDGVISETEYEMSRGKVLNKLE